MKTSFLTSFKELDKSKLELKDYKECFFPLPDNVDAFYAYINLIINNNHNKYVEEPAARPTHFGPVRRFSFTRNEVGEGFVIVYNQKDYDFLERVQHQFCLLRTYWEDIQELVEFDYATKYDRAKPESRRQRGKRMYQQ